MVMVVDGKEIGDTYIIAVRKNLRAFAEFTLSDVQTLFVFSGVDRNTAYRAADRLLQKLRKEGHIKYLKRKWSWV